MAQIKLLKIDADGYQSEHASSDEVTFNTITGTSSINVTSGVSIDNNITFNAVTDTIAGIENQNLLDKTANESITGDYTIESGHKLTLVDNPVNGTDAANKSYVDAAVSGLDWQDSVLDKDLTAPPSSPNSGDRYIVGDSATGDWSGHDKEIAEYNGSSWDFTTTSEGLATWVEDEDKIYVFNGTTWVKFSTVSDHNNLQNLQGGTANEYYHMTAAEDSWMATALTNVPDANNLLDATGNETISGDYTFTGVNNFTNGNLIFPGSANANPVEGDTYWDGTSDILYIYNGSSWVNVSSAGTAIAVTTEYTAGTGGISKYDVVYISGADTVNKADASSLSTAKLVGIAIADASESSNVMIQEDGVIAGILSNATAGTPYFLSTTAGLISTSRPFGPGEIVYKIGYAKNATDLHIQPEFMGRRA